MALFIIGSAVAAINASASKLNILRHKRRVPSTRSECIIKRQAGKHVAHAERALAC